MICTFPGCERGPENGHALYRTSPKGKGVSFEGRCSEHMGALVDPLVREVTSLIESAALPDNTEGR